MKIKSDTSGLNRLRLRIAQTKSAAPGLLASAAQAAGDIVAGDLADAAPQGNSGGAPPPGDGPGPLSESFGAFAESQGSDAAICEVRTTQPQKLEYVTQGTGIYGKYGQRIVPTTKKALYWPGADHPVRSVAGQKANDFVSPVLQDANEVVAEEIEDIIDELSAILGGV